MGFGWESVVWSCFFFKQKTAYEMRISDWSSDGCSSVLWFEWEGFCSLFNLMGCEFSSWQSATTKCAENPSRYERLATECHRLELLMSAQSRSILQSPRPANGF